MNNESKLHKLITKSCRKYKKVGVALSGGVDSSLLAAVIKPHFVISVEMPEGKHNEINIAKKVAGQLGLNHIIVKPDVDKFDEYVEKAVKAIGRPIPHFNIFPLYAMYKKLSDMGESELILGDGPDETMMGYARDLIFDYLYRVYDFEAFKDYKPLIDKILPAPAMALSRMTGRDTVEIYQLISTAERDIMPSLVDVHLMRKDMDDMSNKIAKSFGITNHRPYQDDKELDDFMMKLPMEDKIERVEYGKKILRQILWKYLPYDIAWRKKKVGGPVWPVNKFKGWIKTDGEFGKKSWLEYQKKFL